MILKVYIKNHMFQLPRSQDDLTELIKERLYENKKLVKSAITKLYPISDIDNKNIFIQKNTNIFLLNLYLLILQKKNKLEFTEQTTIDNKIIYEKIYEETKLDVSSVPIEEAEKMILQHLEQNEIEHNQDTEDTSDPFQNIEFSTSWLKKAHCELQNRREYDY